MPAPHAGPVGLTPAARLARAGGSACGYRRRAFNSPSVVVVMMVVVVAVVVRAAIIRSAASPNPAVPIIAPAPARGSRRWRRIVGPRPADVEAEMGSGCRAGGCGEASAGDGERREGAEDGPFQHGNFSCRDAPPRGSFDDGPVTALLLAGFHLKR